MTRAAQKPITREYIYHRLLQLENEIVLTTAAIKRHRGGLPIELIEIADTVLWAQRMMQSIRLRYWLFEDADEEEFGCAGEQYKYFLKDQETALEYYQNNPDKMKLLKQLGEEDRKNGILPRGI